MAIEFIRPKDLPAAPEVNENDSIPVDDGTEVGKATPKEIVDAGRPVATQSEAELGTKNDVAMTPLTTAQAIAADGAGIRSDAIAARNAAEGYRDEAEGFRDEAMGYASAAGGHAGNAAGSASEALGYRNQAESLRDATSDLRDQTQDLRDEAETILEGAAKSEEIYRASLWSFYGDGPSGLSSPPTLVSEDGLVIETAGGAAQHEDIYRASLWGFRGDGPANMADPPLIVSEGERVLASALSVGGGGGAVVDPLIRVISDDGQSNGEAASYGSTSIVYGSGDPRMLTMVRGVENDPWLGMATGGGDSIELDGDTITGIGEMGPQISPSGRNGTTAGEAAVRSRMAREQGRFITLSNAEGGAGIGSLLPDPADPTKYAFANIVTWMERAQALKGANETLRYDLLLMQQGESNRTLSSLGALHEEYRAAVEAEAMRIFGQTERLRMITWQFSSTPEGSSTNAIQSLLDYAIAHDADQSIRHKVYFCGGTTYQFPWASDYLHNSSVGHAMRGETGAAIYRRIQDEGFYLPLHAVSAEVTGANEVTVTLSEAAEQATDLHVEAAADLGVELTGATISGVSVSGAAVIITTSDAADGATVVGFGMQRHSDPRSNATIPRTNIRATRSLGGYSPTLAAQTADGLIRNWMCHQQIAVQS